MKKHILSLFLSFILLTAHCAEDRSADNDDDDDDDITTLTFLVQYEPQPDNDHIEIGLTVEAKDGSLKAAINKVTAVVNQIKDIAETFCNENPEEGETPDCEDVVEIQDFQISADYVRRRKEEHVFQNFVVSHEVTVTVDNTDKIGQLGDKLQKLSNTKIQSFDWASDQEEDDDEEQAIQAGKQKAKDMCFHLGMKLHRIVAVEAVEQDQQENGGDQQEEEQEEEQEGPLVYKFEVECIVDAATAAQKEAEEQVEAKQKAIEQAKQKEKEEKEQQEEKQKKKKKAKAPQKEESDKKKKKK